MRSIVLLALFLILVAACQPNADPLPTVINPEALATERAANNTATVVMLMTLQTHTPTPSFTPTYTHTPSPVPSLTPSRTPTPIPSDTPTPSDTPPPTQASPTPRVVTLAPSATFTHTPQASATRAQNPDALVVASAALRIAPDANAQSITELPANTALRIDQRSADDAWLRVSLLNGLGNGWVAAADVLVFANLAAVEVYVPFTMGTDNPTPPVVGFSNDIGTAQAVTNQTAGTGGAFAPYDFAACGDTYWQGAGLSMEDLAYRGRYPRFARQPVRVYVHGLAALATTSPELAAEWELVIAQTFAELSQAVRLQRVESDDLEFFEPWVPMETILADRSVDMVWHLAALETYQRSTPCENAQSCSRYAFSGAVTGGPVRFGSAVYLPRAVPNKKQALTHAALHALGLWVHSSDPADLLAEAPRTERMSTRDVATLRCLYSAPPYGDSVEE